METNSKNEEILEYLMTSDFNEELNTKELKALLIKFREFYRYMYSAKDNKINDKEFKIKKLKEEIKEKTSTINKLSYDNSELDNEIRKIKKRKLTFMERIRGKVNI